MGNARFGEEEQPCTGRGTGWRSFRPGEGGNARRTFYNPLCCRMFVKICERKVERVLARNTTSRSIILIWSPAKYVALQLCYVFASVPRAGGKRGFAGAFDRRYKNKKGRDTCINERKKVTGKGEKINIQQKAPRT